MKKKPLVSICLLSYNRPETIGRALEGIVSQSYKNIEILVSDNASPDPEVDRIIRSYAARDERITYIRHPTNEGPYRHAAVFEHWRKGEYSLATCDDDYLHPTFIEKMLELHESGDYALVTAHCECYDMHSGKKFMMPSIDSSLFGKNKEESFYNYLSLHFHYSLKGPLFIWGLYKVNKTPPADDVIFGLLKNRIDFYGPDHLFVLDCIATGNVAISPEVLWTRQERFYWGPGHEPWKRNLRQKLVHYYWTIKKNLIYRFRFFTGNISDAMLSLEVACCFIRELSQRHGFNTKRTETIIKKLKPHWIKELT